MIFLYLSLNKMDFTNQILDALEKLKQKELANKEPFKVRAYATVIKNIKALETPIQNIDDLKNVKGIGKSIHDKIIEIMDTGNLKQLEKYDDSIKIINELTQIHGIGPVKAKELVETHNIKSVEDLKLHQNLLNDKQITGLKYHDDFIKRIPRLEMAKHETFLTEVIKKINPKVTLEVVGSYRRGAADSGDIDVILTHEDDPQNFEHVIPEIVAALKKEKYLTDDFAVGPHKYLGVCKLKRHKSFRRIDLLYATASVWPFSILYFTGSADFNVTMRNLALSKGYSLNEYGFKHTTGKNKGETITHTFKTEQDIFAFLGLKYIEPKDRTPKIKLEDFQA